MSSTAHVTLNPPDNSRPSTTINFRIATLNCHGLAKTADVSVRNHFIRYLRTRPLDLLALQGTHALWSPHCGLVCFSPLLSFSDTVYSPCGRIMTTKVSHAQDAFAPVYVTVMYAPANRRDRFLFLDNMAQNRAPLLPICNHRHILLGDFNYTYATYPPSSPPRQAPIPWLSFVDAQLQECVTDLDCAPEITFSKSAARSCIDYVFGSLDL
ncbi:hypothetical protein G6F27_002522 [Rhizopus arrhizus]|nr:hypothetical protein G6F27_002522 [Rhizopus arrhizus]